MVEMSLFYLIDNAVKYSKEGESVSISYDVTQKAGSSRSILEFSILDSGPGMTAKQQDNALRAFGNRFSVLQGLQLFDSRVLKEGSGIGVSTAWEIAKHLGGGLSIAPF